MALNLDSIMSFLPKRKRAEGERPFCTAVIVYLCVNEIVSCLENSVKLNPELKDSPALNLLRESSEQRDAQAVADGHGEQEVAHDVATGNVQADAQALAVREDEAKRGKALLVEHKALGPDVVVRREAHPLGLDAGRLREAVVDEVRKVVVRGHDQERACGVPVRARAHALDDLGLGAGDVLARAEQADVARADVGDDGDVRAGAGGQARELALVVHAHLGHDDLVGRLGAEDGQRQADQVVEVAGGSVGAVARGEALGQHILSRGLTHRARHADDLPLRVAPAPEAGEPQHELLGVVALGAQDAGALLACQGEELRGGLRGHDDRDRSGLDGLRGEAVAVDALAAEAHEDRALAHLARVGRDVGCHATVRAGERLGARCGHDVAD